MITGGIDVGSLTAKAVILDAASGHVLGTSLLRLAHDPGAAGRLALDAALQQAGVAAAALENGAADRDVKYYEGKVTGAKFFARNMLPNLEATRIAIEQIDNDVMELDEAAF